MDNAIYATLTRQSGLLAEMQAIERTQGRDRSGPRWGPRTIDLDLLAYGEQVIDEPQLHVPHPGVAERAFVLVPLAEIAPALVIPGRGEVASLLAAVDVSGIEAIP